MPRAEFHERQYELAANIELISGRGEFFTPPTPLENRLAVDCALTPGDARIWKLLGMSPPPGTKVGPSTFSAWPKDLPPGASPPFPVSLFVQYKRPDFLTTKRSKEWKDHRAKYFRIWLTNHQHQLLLDLEKTVASDAAVLYAAPSFWKFDHMWLRQGSSQIMENSMLVKPSSIGAGHTRWTWTPGGQGVAHSEAEEKPYATIRQVREELTSRARAVHRKSPREHLGAMASAMLEVEAVEKPPDQWRDVVADEMRRAEVEPDEETVAQFVDAAIVAEGATKARVSWLILLLTETPDTTQTDEA